MDRIEERSTSRVQHRPDAAAHCELIPCKRGIVRALLRALALLLVTVSSHAVQAEQLDRSGYSIERQAGKVPANQATEQDRNSERIALLTPPHAFQSAESDIQKGKHLARDFAAKWRDVLARIESDQEALRACRTSPDVCSEAARRLLDIVELGRQRAARARLAEINRAVNLTIKMMSDRTNTALTISGHRHSLPLKREGETARTTRY